ncbi:MAG: hypothetical protein GY940_39775, partial [bacterium]|nr:hypothetical protein [bacterium]
MIEYYGDVTKNEQSRVRLQQESRFMSSSFASELKEAGSVLTLAHTGGYLAEESAFSGIYPLNNIGFPDGIIVATGDPEAFTKLSAAYDASGGGTTLNVVDASVPAYDASYPYENPQWTSGDKGIILGPTGYYVFSVTAADTTNNTISIRNKSVYYSGLLDTLNYTDTSSKGNTVTYTENSPVIRLNNFGIYLFREITKVNSNRIVRQMVRVTDANDNADIFDKNSTAEFSAISENIHDMQISYIAYSSFSSAKPSDTIDDSNWYFAGGTTSSTEANLITAIKKRHLKQLDITVVSLTDEFAGKGEKVQQIPAIADQGSYSLPEGKYGY